MLTARRLVPGLAALFLVVLAVASPASAAADPHARKHPHHGALAPTAGATSHTLRHGRATHGRRTTRHHAARLHGAHAVTHTHASRRARSGVVLSSAHRAAPAATRRATRHAARTTAGRKPVAGIAAPPVTLPRAVPPAAPDIATPSVRTLLGDVPGLVVFSGRTGWLYGGSALFATLLIIMGLVGWRPLGRVRR